MPSQADQKYFDIFIAPILTCKNYKPKLGAGGTEGVNLQRFHEIYGDDPFYSWIGVNSDLMYAAHKAAGGAAYSYLETSLNKICSDAQEANNIFLSVNELHGDGINRCKVFLEELASIDLSSINGKWSNLTILYNIRNCIMHTDGDAEKIRVSDKLIKLAESIADLSFIEKKLVMMTREFVEKSINDIEETLLYLAWRKSR